MNYSRPDGEEEFIIFDRRIGDYQETLRIRISENGWTEIYFRDKNWGGSLMDRGYEYYLTIAPEKAEKLSRDELIKDRNDFPNGEAAKKDVFKVCKAASVWGAEYIHDL